MPVFILIHDGVKINFWPGDNVAADTLERELYKADSIYLSFILYVVPFKLVPNASYSLVGVLPYFFLSFWI